MPKLRPFRDYNEKDVINLFAWSGALPTNNGTFVKVSAVQGGFIPGNEPDIMLGSYGDFQVNNFVAQRYGAAAVVVLAQAQNNDNPLGLLIFDQAEYDENNIPLKYNPRKAAEMQVAISGQASPICTRGTFLYSGVRTTGSTFLSSGTSGAIVTVAVTAGNAAYLGDNGEIATSGNIKIGKFLGSTGVQGSGFNGSDLSTTALVWVNCT